MNGDECWRRCAPDVNAALFFSVADHLRINGESGWGGRMRVSWPRRTDERLTAMLFGEHEWLMSVISTISLPSHQSTYKLQKNPEKN